MSNAKVVIVTASALLIGAAAGYFVSQKVFADRFQKSVDEEVEEVRKAYLDKTRELNSKKKEQAVRVYASEVGTDFEKEQVELIIDREKAETISKLAGYSTAEEYEAAVEATNALNADIQSDLDLSNDYQTFISMEDYLQDNDYEKLVFRYFTASSSLVDEEGEEGDIGATIGRQAAAEASRTDSRYIYVRNDHLRTDYEIDIVESEWPGLVVNIFDPHEGEDDG